MAVLESPMPLNETQTCKQIIEPALTTAGWQFDGQVRLGPGRVRITGPSMYDPHQEIILDYLLRWNGVPLVAFEAKAENEPASDGMQQAQRYAQRLGLRFALASNSRDYILIDVSDGSHETLTAPPSPTLILTRLGYTIDSALWNPVFAQPWHIDQIAQKKVRAYQEAAIFQALLCFAQGINRVLLLIFAKVVEQVNKLHFSDRTDILLLSEIYESLLKQVAADSAGYTGEFYTQRHIIRAMIQVVKPKLGERIYDPCFGSAGFLTECATHLQRAASMSGDQWDKLQNNTFFGIEFKPLSYLLGHMNMILHGIEHANFEMGNTLELHSPNVPSQAKYQVILANPPYGGKLDRQLQTNFTIHSSATEILFLQHIMANLAAGGRAAVIVPEGVLFRGGPDAKVRKRLVEEFNVHTILSLPAGCFLPYTGVKTNIIFFNKERDGCTTQSVWFYDLTNDGFELKQTRKPILGDQLPDFLTTWEARTDSDHSWTLPVEDIAKRGYDLSAKNPHRKADEDLRTPLEIIESIKTKQERIAELANEIEEVLVA